MSKSTDHLYINQCISHSFYFSIVFNFSDHHLKNDSISVVYLPIVRIPKIIRSLFLTFKWKKISSTSPNYISIDNVFNFYMRYLQRVYHYNLASYTKTNRNQEIMVGHS